MTPSAPTPPPRPAARRSTHPVRSLLVLIFRLLLLGVGGTIAGLLGIAAAQLRPAPASQEPPLLEKLLQRTDDLRGTLQPVSVATSTATASAPAQSTSPTPKSENIAPADRQRLQREVASLQTELTTLGNRTTTIEAQVGLAQLPAPLETRLQTLAQQLQSPTATAPAVAPAVSAPADPDRLGVTLPSDALFVANQTTLQPGNPLLNPVIDELQRYPKTTILVAAHTDAEANAPAARERSFAQAQAIAQALAARLGDEYHWVAVGYGQTQPIAANDTPANRQRNRRIEIGILPRE